jgi:predicted MPP superfamily phosphohydrolase
MNDWLGPVALAILLPAAIGHLWHFVLLINVSSGLGYPESAMNRVRFWLFAALWVSSAVLLWMHLRDPFWTWPWPLESYAVLCVISGAIILPLSSLYLAIRKWPDGITGSARTIDLALEKGSDALIGAGRGSWLLRLPGHHSFQLCVREWEVSVPGLPASLDGLTIVQLTDFHFAPCFKRHFFELVVDVCSGLDTDLVLVTGDIVEHDDSVAWIEPVLGRLDARLGRFAVLGNHDYEHKAADVIRELSGAGFVVLEGRWDTIADAGSTIAVGGTAAPWGPAIDPAGIPPAHLRILLSHSPDLFYKAQQWSVDLMFSGHNHGGQVRLPLLGAFFVPSRYSRRFDRGFFRGGRTLLYVNEGIAGMHPVRYGCYPEISRFVLRQAPGRISPVGVGAQPCQINTRRL